MSDPGAARASLAAALEEAAAAGDLARARELIAAGALLTPDALCFAIVSGVNDLVETLLSGGVDANAPDRRGIAPIFFACAAGHPALPAFLADPDHTDIRAAGWPAHSPGFGHGEIVWTLVAHGAAVSARHAPDARRTASGTTALMVAAAFGHVAALDVLIARGANPRDTDYAGRNARDWAERFGQKPAMERLRQFARK